MSTRAVVFDGDDTLWETEPLYDEARAEARVVVESAGLDGAVWEARERQIDVENAEHVGHSADRFPASCVQAYDELCAATGGSGAQAVREAVDAAARTAFTRRAPVVANVKETLDTLREWGYGLALLTKGDPAVQERRIAESGLRPLFDLVEIVHEKTPRSILAVLQRLEASPSESFTVGNSVRSDVLPSLAAGVRPIWIDAHVWEFERKHGDYPSHAVVERKELSEVLGIIPP